MDINKLKQRAKCEYDNIKRRKRELYKYARRLGFSPIEAKILSGTSEENINRLAKDNNPLNNPP